MLAGLHPYLDPGWGASQVHVVGIISVGGPGLTDPTGCLLAPWTVHVVSAFTSKLLGVGDMTERRWPFLVVGTWLLYPDLSCVQRSSPLALTSVLFVPMSNQGHREENHCLPGCLRHRGSHTSHRRVPATPTLHLPSRYSNPQPDRSKIQNMEVLSFLAVAP